MNDFDLDSNSPSSLNLTNHQHQPPIFTSTPLVVTEKPLLSSTSSSFFLPITENTQINNQNNEQLIKLNEDLCLLGLLDFIPSIPNFNQTFILCRQLVKNYNKLSQDKHQLVEKLKKFECEQIKQEKKEDSIKHEVDRLQIRKERLVDDVQKYLTKIEQLTQTIQLKDKEIRRLNQIYNQQCSLAKHQYRTLEKQVNKLKERISNFEKNQFTLSTTESSWPLILNETITMPESSSTEILLKKICYDYDQKHRLLMIENEQLRQCVVEIDQQFQRLLLIHRRPEEILSEINTEDESFETRLMNLPCDAVNEIVQRHFSRLYDQIDRCILNN